MEEEIEYKFSPTLDAFPYELIDPFDSVSIVMLGMIMPVRMWKKYITREKISCILDGFYYEGSMILSMFLIFADYQLDVKIARHILSLFSHQIKFTIDDPFRNKITIHECDCTPECPGKHSVRVKTSSFVTDYLSKCDYTRKNEQYPFIGRKK